MATDSKGFMEELRREGHIGRLVWLLVLLVGALVGILVVSPRFNLLTLGLVTAIAALIDEWLVFEFEWDDDHGCRTCAPLGGQPFHFSKPSFSASLKGSEEGNRHASATLSRTRCTSMED